MKHLWLVAALPLALAAPAMAQTAPVIHALGDEAVSRQSGLHAVSISVDWAPGATTGRHSHPGDEYGIVLEGALTLTTEGPGGATKVIKAGEAYHNARGVVHETRNAGTIPAKSVSVLVTDKGAPLSEPVK